MSETQTFDLPESASEHDINCVAEELTRALNKIDSDSTTYKSVGENVGWQNTSGEAIVSLEDGMDLIRKITPDSPCNIEFEISDEAITVTMTHHDSPMGETHRITACEEPDEYVEA